MHRDISALLPGNHPQVVVQEVVVSPGGCTTGGCIPRWLSLSAALWPGKGTAFNSSCLIKETYKLPKKVDFQLLATGIEVLETDSKWVGREEGRDPGGGGGGGSGEDKKGRGRGGERGVGLTPWADRVSA